MRAIHDQRIAVLIENLAPGLILGDRCHGLNIDPADIGPGGGGDMVAADTLINNRVIVSVDVIVDHRAVLIDGVVLMRGNIVIVELPVAESAGGNEGVVMAPQSDIDADSEAGSAIRQAQA